MPVAAESIQFLSSLMMTQILATLSVSEQWFYFLHNMFLFFPVPCSKTRTALSMYIPT